MLERLLSLVLPVLTSILSVALLLWYLYRYFRPFWAPGEPNVWIEPVSGRRHDGGVKNKLKLLGWILLWVVATRLFFYLTALIGSALSGNAEDFFLNPASYWVRWDANHYLGLAQNGYVNEGDARFHLVFYPLYPLIVRIVMPLFGGRAILAAVVVSNLCLVVTCWVLYHLLRLTTNTENAKTAVRMLLLFPTSLYLSIPYSESIFLMLTVLSVYEARRERIWLAVLFGALASASRIQGMLCAIPVFYEALRLEAKKELNAERVLLRVLQVSLIATGFFAYLLLNQHVSGNPLQFLIYQREHWSQTLGSIPQTLRYTIENAFFYEDQGARLGIWYPQLAAILGAFTVLALAYWRVHPADGAYALIYLWISFSPTWLLSGPRYLMAMYALYPMLAYIARTRVRKIVLYALLAVGAAYCSLNYAVFGSLL